MTSRVRAWALAVGLAATGAGLVLPVRGFPYKVRIFYLPMFSYTEPLNSAGIEGAYDLTSVLYHDTDKLEALLMAADDKMPEFSEDLVRIKLVRQDGSVLLYDLDGNVRAGKKTHHLSMATRKKIHRLIKDALPDS